MKKNSFWIRGVLVGLLLMPLMPTTSLAQDGEERWNYTMLDVANVQGANNYRVSWAAVIEVTRSRLQTGERKYSYSVKEAAGRVAGQKRALVFSGRKSEGFYYNNATRTFRTEDEELTPLFDVMNNVVETLPPERKRIGDRWQQAIRIAKGSEFLPGTVIVRFEVQGLSPAGYGKVLLIRYSSEEMTFRTVGGDTGQVRAEFSGLTTYDPEKDVTLHSVWNFKATRQRAEAKSDVFSHRIVSFMSDAGGGKPVVPFGIYPDLRKAFAQQHIDLTTTSSDPDPPAWFVQTFALSQMAWTVTGITAEGSTNDVGLVLKTGLSVGNFIIDKVTDVWNDGQFNNNGINLQKLGAEQIARDWGLDPKWGTAFYRAFSIGSGLLTVAMYGPTPLGVVMLGVAILDALDLKVERAPADRKPLPQQVDWSMKNAIQDFTSLVKLFEPIAKPFVPLAKPISDAAQLSERTAQQQLTPVTSSFTQTYSGNYEKPSSSPFRAASYTGSGTGTRSGVIPGSFSLNYSITATSTQNNTFSSFSSGTFSGNTSGTVSGLNGGKLTGTMNVTGSTTGGTSFSFSAPVTIQPSGNLSYSTNGTFRLGGNSGTTTGTWTQTAK